jgi:GNAT superfamily N-acetyltransferase
MWMGIAEEKDFAEIVELANWAYRGREDDERSWNLEAGILEGQRMNRSLLEEEMAERQGGALLVFREAERGVLLGTAWVYPVDGDVWHLSLLTVRPDRQDGGFGRVFLEKAEDHARGCGARVLRMSVLWVRDALMGWYERRGYRRIGEREAFPYGDDRFGKPLRDDLWFEVLEKAL